MSTSLKIVSQSVIRKGNIYSNGNHVFKAKDDEFKSTIKDMYRYTEAKYPKFFKMDNLCKLAFVGAEELFRNVDVSEVEPQRIGIVLMNRASSLDTDRVHQQSIDNREAYFPSPAVFVYTLANIMAGEIAIRNKFQGENMCFISSQFDGELLNNYVTNLFHKNRVDYCLCGWVDFDNQTYESVQVLVSKSTVENTTFDASTLNKIYNTKY